MCACMGRSIWWVGVIFFQQYVIRAFRGKLQVQMHGQTAFDTHYNIFIL